MVYYTWVTNYHCCWAGAPPCENDTSMSKVAELKRGRGRAYDWPLRQFQLKSNLVIWESNCRISVEILSNTQVPTAKITWDEVALETNWQCQFQFLCVHFSRLAKPSPLSKTNTKYCQFTCLPSSEPSKKELITAICLLGRSLTQWDAIDPDMAGWVWKHEETGRHIIQLAVSSLSKISCYSWKSSTHSPAMPSQGLLING